MFKFVLAAVLASAVAGCVTSDGPGPYSQSAARAARVQQAAKTTDKPAKSPEAHSQLLLGAAY
jgi:hypothetical protein